MKFSIIFHRNTILAITALMFLYSCEKSLVGGGQFDKSQLSFRSEPTTLIPNFEYLYNGLETKLGSEIQESDSMSIVSGYDSNVYVFANDSILLAWAVMDSSRSFIVKCLDSIAVIHAFADSLGLLNDSLATERYIETDTPESPFSIWLWSGFEQTGKSWWGTRWSYGANNNTASSFVLVWGNAMLCDKTWWRGEKLFLWGFPANNGNLDYPYFFNNRAQSGLGM